MNGRVYYGGRVCFLLLTLCNAGCRHAARALRGAAHARRLPVAQLRARLPLCVRALLTLMKVLPPHAAAEQRRLRETLDVLLSRCLPPAPDAEPQAASSGAAAGAEPMDHAAPAAEARLPVLSRR